VTTSARLPVEPERLRREFPALTAEDVAAYVQVTRRILDAAADARPRVTRDALEGGRRAREKAARGEPLDAGEALLARYLDALAKMQRKGPAPEP
jgi:hypothetical protein